MVNAPDTGALFVRDVMRADLPTVSAGTPASSVAAQMVASGWRHVLVSDEDHALLGLVDRLRLLRHMARLEGEDGDEPIQSFLLSEPIVTSPDAPLSHAVRRMARHRIGSLPVLEGGRLVGLISERTLLPFAERLLDPNQTAHALTDPLVPGQPTIT